MLLTPGELHLPRVAGPAAGVWMWDTGKVPQEGTRTWRSRIHHPVPHRGSCEGQAAYPAGVLCVAGVEATPGPPLPPASPLGGDSRGRTSHALSTARLCRLGRGPTFPGVCFQVVRSV